MGHLKPLNFSLSEIGEPLGNSKRIVGQSDLDFSTLESG